MEAILFDREWSVDEAGYEIVERKTDGGGIFNVVSRVSRHCAVRTYRISGHPGMFREFADLYATGQPWGNRGVSGPISPALSERFRRFANQYGYLYKYRPRDQTSNLFWTDPTELHDDYVEVLDVPRECSEAMKEHVNYFPPWRKRARELRRAISDWDALKTRNRSFLRKHYRLKDGRLQLISNGNWRSTSDPPFPDLEAAVKYRLCTEVSVHLYADVLRTGRSGMITRVVPVADALRCRIEVEPETLWDAMWIQLANEMAGIQEVRKCESEDCPKYFAVTTKPRRFKKKYCGDACARREQRRQANQK